MTPTYSKIRFIGYAIPTTPANLISIGNPNGPGAVAGTYLGNADYPIDISKRIDIMKNAVDTAKKNLPPNEADVINVFVVPEFYFHGLEGPYIYDGPDNDPLNKIQSKLKEVFKNAAYENWIFICGSAITTEIKDPEKTFGSNSVTTRNNVVKCISEQWQASFGPLKGVIFDMLVNFIQNCHSHPNCEVRNRSVIVSNIPIRTPEHHDATDLMTTEKYFVSNEDFLLYEVTGKQVITEQMTAYPHIDLSGGDAKKAAFDKYAIFRQNCIDPNNSINTSVMDYGIEICLDHSDIRLRRNIENEPNVIGGIHVQLIPSCGMQISLSSIAADHNGFVFNCDGQYALNNLHHGQAVISDVDCLFANYSYDKNADYKAHSQLARVKEPASVGDPNAAGSTNASLQKLNDENVSVVNVSVPSNLEFDKYYAGGPGQLHFYGLINPYTLYP